jgi:xanthine dehydrogenase small subunit
MTGANLRQSTTTINGEAVPVDAYRVQSTLLDFLRDRGLTGAREGCAEGECGACTVLMMAENGAGSEYRPVNSCLMFLPDAIDREFYTVETLARNGQLAEVQQAIASGGGSQCGYCTPGFVMSLFAEQYRPGRVGPCDPESMGGNLCRCTGYRPLRDAALAIGPAPAGLFLDRLAQPAPALKTVHLVTGGARFTRPGNLAECLSMLDRHPEAKVICGGTDLGVESNLRFRRWPHLISLQGVDALREYSEDSEKVRIGAALPLGEIERRWTSAPSAVGKWLRFFASPPIRNRATLGGNLATASPIGDSAPLLLALDASLVLTSIRGSRNTPLALFFSGYRQTQLEDGEVIRLVEIPKPFPAFLRFYKASKRRMDDISTVAAGLSLDWDDRGRIARARFAFGGVAPVPLRVFAAEEAALGQLWNESAVHRIQREIERALQPIDDHRGSAAYRLALAKGLVEKFYWEWREAA